MSRVMEAFYFARTQAPATHRHLFEFLISLTIHNSPKQTIAERSVELVNLPFSPEEEEWFEEYLEHGDGRSLAKSKDTLMMRKIGTGKFTESLAVKGVFSVKGVSDLEWRVLLKGVRNGLGPR